MSAPLAPELIPSMPGNLAIRASAGTGKTYTLTKTILHQLAGLNPAETVIAPQQILAITFTEKAATEMKERIRRGVRALAGDPTSDPGLNATVRRQHGDDVRLATVLPDRAHWRGVLSELDRMTVATYHGFAHSVLLQHPVEARLSLDVELLDEQGSELLLSEVITDVVRRALASTDPIGHDVAMLVQRFGLTPKRWVGSLLDELKALIRSLRQAGVTAAATPAHDGDAEALYAEGAAQVIAGARALGELADDPMLDRSRAGAELMALGARARDIVAGFERQGETPTLRNHARLLFPIIKRTFGDLRKNVFRLRAAELTPLRDGVTTVAMALMWAMSTTARTLAIRIEDELTRRKRAQRVMTFTDLILGLRTLLETHPTVRRALQARYAKIFVDEFQDTNEAQLDLVTLLARDASAPGGAGDPDDPTRPELGPWRPATLFVVGDPKQSIYGWRGARVDLFFALFDRLTEQGGHLGVLSRNYRSSHPLVEAGNRLFARAMGDDFDTERDAAVADRTRTAHAPSCVLYSVRDEPPASRYQRSKPVLAIADVIARIAGQWLWGHEAKRVERRLSPTDRDAMTAWATGDLGAPSWLHPDDANDTLRERVIAGDLSATLPARARPAHLTVLVRTGWQADQVSRALDEAGIPNVALVGRGFWAATEVVDAVVASLALLDPTFDGALVALCRSPWVGFTDDALTLLSHTPTPPTWDALDALDAVMADDWPHAADRNALHTLRQLDRELRPAAHTLPPDKLVHALIDITGVDTVLAGLPHGARRLANLAQLVDLARDAADAGSDAWRWAWQAWEAIAAETKQESAQVVSEADDVVRIVTIHRAKGLEFPLSIVWGVSTAARGDRHWAIYDRDAGILVKPTRELALPGYTSDVRPQLEVLERYAKRDVREQSAEAQRIFYVAHTRASDHLAYVGRVPVSGDLSPLPKGWMAPLEAAADAGEIARVTMDSPAELDAHLPAVAPPSRQATDDEERLAVAAAEQALAQANLAHPLPVSGHAVIGLTTLNTHMPYLAPAETMTVEQAAVTPLPLFAALQPPVAAGALDIEERELEDEPRADELDGAAFGTLVHAALEHYRWSGESASVDDAMQAIGVQPRAVVSRVRQHVERAVAHIAPLVDGGAPFPELPFLLDTGRVGELATSVRGTIDLLVLWPDAEPLVIDYKTSPQLGDEQREAHERQLLAYAAAVFRLVTPPPSGVRCRLVYTGDATVAAHEVRYTAAEVDAWAEAARAAVAARVQS